MKLLLVAYNYPSMFNPVRGVFVKNIVDEFIRQGIEVKVIAPHTIGTFFLKGFLNQLFKKGVLFKREPDRDYVHRPLCISIGNLKIGKFYLSQYFFDKAVNRICESKLKSFKPDIVYGHFIRPAGITALKISQKNNVESFIAVGEGNIDYIDDYIFSTYVNNVSGIICVSEKNKYAILERSKLRSEQILLVQNSVNREVFNKKCKVEMREKFGFPQDSFILIFVGYFEERKGLNRVIEALEGIDESIKLICIGQGPQKPKSRNSRILFCDIVENKNLPEYLNCADVFILPTLFEGSCNAIAEAMACGLPIISSNIPEVKIQVGKNSILVDPINISAIKTAILQFFNDSFLTEEFGNESIKIADNYSIKDRAKKIIDFITEIKTNVKI